MHVERIVSNFEVIRRKMDRNRGWKKKIYPISALRLSIFLEGTCDEEPPCLERKFILWSGTVRYNTLYTIYINFWWNVAPFHIIRHITLHRIDFFFR